MYPGNNQSCAGGSLLLDVEGARVVSSLECVVYSYRSVRATALVGLRRLGDVVDRYDVSHREKGVSRATFAS